MHVREGEYEKAYADFFEAFKNYDEAGSPRRTQCVKFLILSVMLRESQIDPFESPELKAYGNHPQLEGFLKLFTAYKSSDIKMFEKILHDYRADIMDDTFIKDQIEDLVRGIRSTAVLNFIHSRESVDIPTIATTLNLPESELANILVVLYQDKRTTGRLALASDGITMVWKSSNMLAKEGVWNDPKQIKRYNALIEWSHQLNTMIFTVHNKLS
jgi:COP9 signalosome complex subunit 2